MACNLVVSAASKARGEVGLPGELLGGLMNVKLFGVLVSVFALAACGDSGSSGGNGGSSDGGGGATTDGGGGATTDGGGGSTTDGGGGATNGGGGAGGGNPECPGACEALYDCGVEDMNCMFTGDPAEKEAFVEGCIPGCNDNAVLIAVIDPENCAGTIATVKGASEDFAASCDNGIGN